MFNETKCIFKNCFTFFERKEKNIPLRSEFLSEYNLKHFLVHIFSLNKRHLIMNCFPNDKIRFSHEYGWDIFIDNCEYHYCSCVNKDMCFCFPTQNLKTDSLFCQTIDVIREKDYVSILIKMKNKIKQTNKYVYKNNIDTINHLNKLYREGWFISKEEYNQIIDKNILIPRYVLIVRKFKGNPQMKSQFIKECIIAHIKLIFWEDIFKDKFINDEYWRTLV